jgi:hypothetical protein
LIGSNLSKVKYKIWRAVGYTIRMDL